MNMSGAGRSALTLVALAVVFLGGITWAWSQITEPFPEAEETPLCTDTVVSAGESVRPGQVLVSVLNASGRNGLAGETMDGLVERGFGKGESGNVSVAGAKTLTAQIWTTDTSNPSVMLVRSYLGKGVEVVEQEAATAGVTVVVGERFGEVTKGRKQVKASDETTVCAPALVVEQSP
ncbi:LytR family transcriptional regulator [Nocardioides sp. BGMRC 2183]|nr:LytR family transcriptional regulator [Nocardioides sp. BGMRC 2183]